jgi:hypothetical protein
VALCEAGPLSACVLGAFADLVGGEAGSGLPKREVEASGVLRQHGSDGSAVATGVLAGVTPEASWRVGFRVGFDRGGNAAPVGPWAVVSFAGRAVASFAWAEAPAERGGIDLINALDATVCYKDEATFEALMDDRLGSSVRPCKHK